MKGSPACRGKAQGKALRIAPSPACRREGFWMGLVAFAKGSSPVGIGLCQSSALRQDEEGALSITTALRRPEPRNSIAPIQGAPAESYRRNRARTNTEHLCLAGSIGGLFLLERLCYDASFRL